tara:strand:+ start:217 stop:582 length:366 start_codon:yes stop_codon:yes gene_type:complete
MPTYYKHITGKKIGGLPEVVRINDGFEQLLTNNYSENFKNGNDNKYLRNDRFENDLQSISQDFLVHQDNVKISGFRFDLKKPMIGSKPYYSSHIEPCNRIEYRSNMRYPFLLNDDLLFTCD